MNLEAAGKIYAGSSFTVGPDRVAAFRSVFDEIAGVPATFPTVAEFAVIPVIVADPEVGIDFTRVLHGGQEYAFERPLREGETLTITSTIESIKEYGGNAFLVLVTELTEPGGRVVCTARSTLIEREAG
jgi:hypothetical protein